MKKDKIIFWILTGLLSLGIGIGAVFNAMSSPESLELIQQRLGFPAYVVPLLGVAKILGIIVILIPGFPRLKEWAYAGLVFDLGGAIYSFISIGAPVSEWAAMFIFIAMIFGSYFFHHRILKGTGAASQ